MKTALGMRRLVLLASMAFMLCAWSSICRSQAEPPGCLRVARLVSGQGLLQIQRAGQDGWSYVRARNLHICQGDVIYAEPGSRATLLVSTETVIRLGPNSSLRITQTANETVAEFVLPPVQAPQAITTPNPCGAGYFITRYPKRFKVITPFVDAVIEGTEFLVAMRCEDTQIAVFEGRVRAEPLIAGATLTLNVAAGQTLTAGPREPPTIQALIKPIDAVQWALYYPPLTEPDGDAGVDQSCTAASPSERAACLSARAEQRLRAGGVDEAQNDIQTALALNPKNADASALLAVISIVKNEKTNALALAHHATALEPLNPRAWIALSYAQQANFELKDALDSAERASSLASDSSTAHARVAELLMSLGKTRTAERAARAAVDTNPKQSKRAYGARVRLLSADQYRESACRLH